MHNGVWHHHWPGTNNQNKTATNMLASIMDMPRIGSVPVVSCPMDRELCGPRQTPMPVPAGSHRTNNLIGSSVTFVRPTDGLVPPPCMTGITTTIGSDGVICNAQHDVPNSKRRCGASRLSSIVTRMNHNKTNDSSDSSLITTDDSNKASRGIDNRTPAQASPAAAVHRPLPSPTRHATHGAR